MDKSDDDNLVLDGALMVNVLSHFLGIRPGVAPVAMDPIAIDPVVIGPITIDQGLPALPCHGNSEATPRTRLRKRPEWKSA